MTKSITDCLKGEVIYLDNLEGLVKYSIYSGNKWLTGQHGILLDHYSKNIEYFQEVGT
jgi:hypothetical protein